MNFMLHLHSIFDDTTHVLLYISPSFATHMHYLNAFRVISTCTEDMYV